MRAAGSTVVRQLGTALRGAVEVQFEHRERCPSGNADPAPSMPPIPMPLSKGRLCSVSVSVVPAGHRLKSTHRSARSADASVR